jgi:4-hydroxy-2-oxovalerate aldolase
MVAALERAGVGWIEAGHGLGLGAPASGKVKSAESAAGYMQAARMGAKTAKVGVFAMPAFATVGDIERAAGEGMDFIRVGADAARFRDAEAFARAAVKCGLHTTVFLMKSYSLHLAELEAHCGMFEDWGASAVAIVDSAGGMTPEQVTDYVRVVHDHTRLDVCFHGHDNMRLACGNALAAAAAGATMLDASLRGIGRSSGNAQIEALAAGLERSGYPCGVNPLALCAVAEQFITDPATHNGVGTIDLVQGMAKVHSGMQARIDKAAAVFGVDPQVLTLMIGEASGGLDMSEDEVMGLTQRFVQNAHLQGRAFG